MHIADSLDQLTEWSAQMAMGAIPAHPFMLYGQQSLADPSRAPSGAATGWGYTHVPRRVRGDAGGSLTGSWTGSELEEFATRLEARIERRAPGFRDLILARHVMGPREMEARDANLGGGAVNGGTSQLHQQLLFRPVPGPGRPTTPFRGLYLASSAAHPGGGVHGAPGANAAPALAADAPAGLSASAVWEGRGAGRAGRRFGCPDGCDSLRIGVGHSHPAAQNPGPRPVAAGPDGVLERDQQTRRA